jgi:hypothetical protein
MPVENFDSSVLGQRLVAPFPYFGGKRTIADEVWKRLGDVKNYVEPCLSTCRRHPQGVVFDY